MHVGKCTWRSFISSVWNKVSEERLNCCRHCRFHPGRLLQFKTTDKVLFLFLLPISSPNPNFDSSHLDDSYNWSNMGICEEITQEVWIQVNFAHLIWSSVSFGEVTARYLYWWQLWRHVLPENQKSMIDSQSVRITEDLSKPWVCMLSNFTLVCAFVLHNKHYVCLLVLAIHLTFSPLLSSADDEVWCCVWVGVWWLVLFQLAPWIPSPLLSAAVVMLILRVGFDEIGMMFLLFWSRSWKGLKDEKCWNKQLLEDKKNVATSLSNGSTTRCRSST